MQPIIRVENLGKQYHLGASQAPYATLRDTLVGAVRAPFRRWQSRAENSSNTFWAVKDVSFEIAPGEVVGIIGRNGAGKSTLLKLLSRITEPTTGGIDLYGRVGSLLEVGTGFHPELSGRENIFLNGAILGMHRQEIARKFDEIVEFAEVEKFLDTPVKHYSSGMYVRLAFAVAAHLEPEILIVDEVLAVGDAQFQKKCLGKMNDVAQQGRTVLFVSHNMGAVNQLCTRALQIAVGQVKNFGPTREIVTDYLSEMFKASSGDLAQLRTTRDEGNIRFTRIELSATGGTTLSFGQTVEYILTVEADVDMDELSIGSSVFNLSGHCVGSLVTREQFAVAAGNTVTLRLSVPGTNLAPGSYYASFSIGRGGHEGLRQDLDAIIGMPAFQVLPISDERDPVANWNPNWGAVVFREAHLTTE